MSGQVVGYVRVSSVEQNTARQVSALGEVEETFTDRLSGKDVDRPQLSEMLRFVRAEDTAVASLSILTARRGCVSWSGA